MKLDFAYSALLIVDVQNDFCPGGALEVKDGDKVIGPINKLTSRFAAGNGRVAATQDWHPEKHGSFAASHGGKKPYDTINLGIVKNQVLWPKHCVQGGEGAEFHKDLDLKPVSFIIRKGFRTDLDSYSAFFENDRKTATGLDGFLKSFSIKTVIIGGLAMDYCVFYSAIDAKALGYQTIVVSDAVCGIDFPAGSIEKAQKLLQKTGVAFVPSRELQ